MKIIDYLKNKNILHYDPELRQSAENLGEIYKELLIFLASTKNNLIEEGDTGCVVSPPLECIEPGCEGKRCTDGVSKILTRKNAKRELDKYDFLELDKIDPSFDYHIKKPHLCTPKILEDFLYSCQKSYDDPQMLIYDNGGYNLGTLLNIAFTDLYQTGKKELFYEIINKILKQFLHLLEGIELFNRHGICIYEINDTNVLTSISSLDDIDKLRFKLTNFKLSVKYKPLDLKKIFDGNNGYHYSNVNNFENTYKKYSIDTLFISKLEPGKIGTQDTEIYSKVRYYHRTFLAENKDIRFINLYRIYKEKLNIDSIEREFPELYKEETMDVIMLNYLESHDSFSFALILMFICYNYDYKKIFEPLEEFLIKSKIIDYNPMKRCKSVNIIPHYIEFLKKIGIDV